MRQLTSFEPWPNRLTNRRKIKTCEGSRKPQTAVNFTRVLKCDVIILQTFPFEPHRAIHTAAVRMCAKLQIASINESED